MNKQPDNSSIYSVYLEKLNTKMEDLVKSNNELTLS